MTARVLLTLFVAAVPTSVFGQFTEFRAWTPPAGEAKAQPTAACSSLRALTGYQFSVVSAVVETASGGGGQCCRVVGQVLPEVKFEVALPVSWNKRLVMIGNGGYAGENLESPQRTTLRDDAVRAGFAFTQTNTGHDASDGPPGSFATDRQELVDYAFRAVHVTAETAKKIAAAYYGTAPARSYFVGCSTGGRQGLISAQRFPHDFDGILAGAPVLDFVGTMVSYAGILRAFEAAPVPAAKMKLVADAIYSMCDEKDGVKDGVITDPRRCGFEPTVHLKKCTGAETADCFTKGQIRSLETLYSDQKINGQRVYPGWPVGAEIAGSNGRPGWEPWLVNEKGDPIFVVFSEAFFRYMAFAKKDPDFKLKQLDLERDYPRLDAMRQMLNATDPGLSGFRDRGGKLLMYFGWADPALNPNRAIEYYEAVTVKMGARTRDFFRLYMMPGMFHCSGGVGCDSAPRLAALTGWVERNQVPEAIVASRLQNGKVVRTRPLCPYPEVAKYQGAGSTDEAGNFRCAAFEK
jgi:hypothetical protein